MKQALPQLSRRTLFKQGITMLGLAITWRLLPPGVIVQAKAVGRPYGAGSYGAGAYGSSSNVYVPIVLT